MGYTHYLYQREEFTAAEWAEVQSIASDIFDRAIDENRRLADGTGTPGTAPLIDADVVSFNGEGDESYETCAVDRVPTYQVSTGWYFSCCKTRSATRPYDPVVLAFYVALRCHFPDKIRVSTDGDADAAQLNPALKLLPEDTVKATAMIQKACGLTMDEWIFQEVPINA